MIKKIFNPIIVLALGFTLLAAPTLAEDKSNMQARIKTWQAAFNAGDAAAVAAHFTKDARRMPYQAPALAGLEAIADGVQGAMDLGIKSVKLSVDGAESQGTLAWAHGSYTLMDVEGNVMESGKWMNVSRKVGDTWLIEADIWNTDAPE